MKKLTIVVASVVTGLTAYTQKIEATKLPEPVKTSFAKMYPEATNAKWEMEKGSYEVEFKQSGSSMSSLFKPDGTMTESEIDIKITDLPQAALSYVKEHYKGKQIKEAAKITKASGEINYEAEVEGKDLIFDTKGIFLKAEKE